MQAPHIAFFPIPAKAHIYSTLEISRELIKRKYRVSYSVPEQYRLKILELGAEAITYYFNPANVNVWGKAESPTDPVNWEDFLLTAGSVCTMMAVNSLAQVFPFFKQNRPDLIIYDSVETAGRILSRIEKIPSIQFFPHFAFYNDFFSKKNGYWMTPEPSDDLCKKVDNFYTTFSPIEKLNICFYPREFQFNEEKFDDRFYFPGPCIRDLKNENIQSIGAPTIVISASASVEGDINYFRFFIDTLRHENQWNIILSIGQNVDNGRLGDIPNHIIISSNTPQVELVSTASLFIGSGGMVSTLEALYYGVPTILIPPWIGQAEVAYRMKKLGIGIVLEKNKLSKSSLMSAIKLALSDKRMEKRISKMQAVIKSSGGTEGAVNKIEQYLNNELSRNN